MDNLVDAAVSRNKKYVIAVYVLQSLAFLGILFAPIMGVVLNYIKDDDVKGTWLESHFLWQKRTFWYGLLWSVVGAIMIFFISWVIGIAVTIWYFYRIAKGWINYADGKPMYQ